METKEDTNICQSENKSKGKNLPQVQREESASQRTGQLAKGVLSIHS